MGPKTKDWFLNSFVYLAWVDRLITFQFLMAYNMHRWPTNLVSHREILGRLLIVCGLSLLLYKWKGRTYLSLQKKDQSFSIQILHIGKVFILYDYICVKRLYTYKHNKQPKEKNSTSKKKKLKQHTFKIL